MAKTFKDKLSCYKKAVSYQLTSKTEFIFLNLKMTAL